MAVKNISYREAILEIEEIISKIENQETDVDEMTSQVKRVSQLIKLCKDKLYKTETEVQKVLDGMNEVS